MRFAFSLRGIHFYENYCYFLENRYLEPYTIDCSLCIDKFVSNIIKPLEDQGHIVDVFFRTYDTPHLINIKEKLNPVKVSIDVFNPNIKPNNGAFVYNYIAVALQDIQSYQLENNIEYDYIISTRFDSYIFENITKLLFPLHTLSLVDSINDSFIVFTGDIMESITNGFISLSKKGGMALPFWKDFGVSVHVCYSNNNSMIIGQNSFYKNIRQFLVPRNHLFYISELNDIYDPKSRFYSFIQEINTQPFIVS
jgi:hypothetical protein